MGKTEVIVDTCFLQKLSSEGKAIDNIKKVLTEIESILKAMRERSAVSSIKAVWRKNHPI